jgi:hypothetical protein
VEHPSEIRGRKEKGKRERRGGSRDLQYLFDRS